MVLSWRRGDHNRDGTPARGRLISFAFTSRFLSVLWRSHVLEGVGACPYMPGLRVLSAPLVDGSPRRLQEGASDVPHRHPALGGAAASGTPGGTAAAWGPLATAQPWA